MKEETESEFKNGQNVYVIYDNKIVRGKIENIGFETFDYDGGPLVQYYNVKTEQIIFDKEWRIISAISVPNYDIFIDKEVAEKELKKRNDERDWGKVEMKIAYQVKIRIPSDLKVSATIERIFADELPGNYSEENDKEDIHYFHYRTYAEARKAQVEALSCNKDCENNGE